MLISEIFLSIQGEGELMGVPSVFVRTSGCNLRCAWCDTPYASWNPEGVNRAIDAVVKEVQGLGAARHVVLTGGEPMIAKGLAELARELKRLGYHVTIETAATVAPEGIACDLASLSPKLLNSAPNGAEHGAWRRKHEATRWQPAVIRAWIDGGYRCQFKFVVSRPEDVAELQGMLASLDRDLPPERVLLMPEGVTMEAIRSRAGWLTELCKSLGYRYTHRLQIELFGNKRGT
ncbi:MAG TPA: radical SAM protein [Opitutaceae bacterium]|jgi:7-carboxy-7-deazaguanine synthase|nr:radical SAM protein [Opitutaceae bacterium]